MTPILFELILLGVLSPVFYLGLRMVFDKEWAWRRQELANRRRGIQKSERTSEWERDSTRVGWGLVVCGLILAAAPLFLIK
jgi:hypothetical protein